MSCGSFHDQIFQEIRLIPANIYFFKLYNRNTKNVIQFVDTRQIKNKDKNNNNKLANRP